MPRLTIEVGFKTSTDVKVTVVGEGLYRLEEEPLLFLAAENEAEAELLPHYGDTMAAQRLDGLTLRYVLSLIAGSSLDPDQVIQGLSRGA